MLTLTHFATESFRDFFRVRFPIQKALDGDDQVHLNAAVTFITRSIEQCNGCASSKAYLVGKGWLPAYRETTGYIIPTLLDLAEHLKRPDLASMAERLGEWLSQVQEPTGGFIERDLHQDTKPVVFNTGQILHGFNSLILRQGRQDLIPSAQRAGDFIVSSADETGSFTLNEHYGIAHAYNVRTAWALLTLGRLLNEKRYEAVALANADWTVAQQSANGFFLNNIFQPGWNANTHGIAYVLQGLLEYFLHLWTRTIPHGSPPNLRARRVGLRSQGPPSLGDWRKLGVPFQPSVPDGVRAAGNRALQALRH